MIPRCLAPFVFIVGLIGATAPSLIAQDASPNPDTSVPGLLGRIEKNVYISPTKMFRIQVPVLAELGGVTTDAENGVVTFQDDVSIHASVACFAMDATQRWNEETRGRQDYLQDFFADIVRNDFAQHFPGSKLESSYFRPHLMNGAVFAFVTLPGGTMFGEHTIASDNMPSVAAKRGNLLFIKDEHIYVISVELAERVLEHTTWNKTPAEENEILDDRLRDLLLKITFAKVAPADGSSGTPSPAPTQPAPSSAK